MTARNDMAVLETIREVVDHTAAGKVFGTPISQDGLTVVPVAKIKGGGGGGGGTAPMETETAGSGSGTGSGSGSGSGGGMGVSAKPLGVFVLKNGHVGWRPAVDVNRMILGGQLVAVAALLVLRAAVKARRRRARRFF